MRVHIYGNPAGDRAAFQLALEQQCKALDIDLDLTVGSCTPAIAIVFPEDGSAWRVVDAGLHPGMDAVAYPVLPVIAIADDAALLPAALKSYNAFQTRLWSRHWCAGLVDEVLSHALLHRRERRVFLSYKRTDSEPIANQVYDALTRRGYITFLDDVSIDKGLDFQRELKWWLNDADVLLVLLSPNFDQSRWCMEEIAFAQSRSVAVVAVEWPASVYQSGLPFADGQAASTPPVLRDATDEDQRMTLQELSFAPSHTQPPAKLWRRELTDEALHDVMALCARQRSLAIWRRVEDLIPLAQEMLKPEKPLQRVGEAGDFKFDDAAGTTHFVRVLPHRPDARSLRATYTASASETVVGCFYSECDPQDGRAEALRWLSDRIHEDGGVSRHTRLWPYLGDKEVT